MEQAIEAGPPCQALLSKESIHPRRPWPISLTDLPNEILLHITDCLAYDYQYHLSKRIPHTPARLPPHPLKTLRLTSRVFAELLMDDLLGALKITTHSSAIEFLDWHIKVEAILGSPPLIRRLSVGPVCASAIEHDSPPGIPYTIVEALLAKVATTILQLRITFLECFEFSQELIASFRRAKQLSVLHLDIATSPTHPSHIVNSLKSYHPHPFFSALAALPNLRELNLSRCLNQCAPLNRPVSVYRLPRIRHLIFDSTKDRNSSINSPYITLKQLCASVSTSLKTLEIKGSRFNPTHLVPLLEVVQQGLEALHISELSLIRHCSQLEFPQLRSIMLNDTRYLLNEEFESPLFRNTVTLAIRTWKECDLPLEIPVESLSNLHRIILTHTPRPSDQLMNLFRACRNTDKDLLLTEGPIDIRVLRVSQS